MLYVSKMFHTNLHINITNRITDVIFATLLFFLNMTFWSLVLAILSLTIQLYTACNYFWNHTLRHTHEKIAVSARENYIGKIISKTICTRPDALKGIMKLLFWHIYQRAFILKPFMLQGSTHCSQSRIILYFKRVNICREYVEIQ